MASATDIITYIGVPLAVLGVTPIFYTFVSALYTRYKLYRVCSENGLKFATRTRLMAGVVEIDLPNYQLQPFEREIEAYWSVSKPKKISGASWSCFGWFIIELGHRTSRLQRSDTMVLPEAKINLAKLIDFLQDRGASPSRQGFDTLRKRGQQTPEETTLMESRNTVGPATPGQSSVPILSFLKPHGGSISLVLSNGSRLTRPRIFEDIAPYPSSWIIIPLHAGIYGEHLIVQMGTLGIECVNIQIRPGSDLGVQIDLNGLMRDELFTAVVIAVYGHRGGTYHRYRTAQPITHVAQWYSIEVDRASELRLLSDLKAEPAIGEWLEMGSHRWTSSYDAKGNSGDHQKTWVSHEELRDFGKPWPISRSHQSDTSYLSKHERHISMQCLLHFCLSSLITHSAVIEGLKLPEVPAIGHLDYPTFEHFVQDFAEAIVRAAILDEKFAEGVKRGLMFSSIPTQHRDKPTKRDRFRSPVYVSCGVVLLAVLGQRAEYLLSGGDIEFCENEWKEVYLA